MSDLFVPEKRHTFIWVLPHRTEDGLVEIKSMDRKEAQETLPRLTPEATPEDISKVNDTYSRYMKDSDWARWMWCNGAIAETPGYKRDSIKDDTGFWEYIQTVPKRLDNLRILSSVLKRKFNGNVSWHPKVAEFIKAEKAKISHVTKILDSPYSELPIIAENNRKLYRALHIGPRGKDMSVRDKNDAFKNWEPSYQTTDVKFLADCPNPLNGNQPGVGKTIETIGAIIEGRVAGPWLVVCPLTAINRVWASELTHWQQDDVYLATGSKQERLSTLAEAHQRYKDGDRNFWVVCNPEMIRFKGNYKIDNWTGEKVLVDTVSVYPEFHEIEWGAVILDEFHRMGMGNPSTLSSRAMRKLKANKKIALSGTPMGGKPIRLFGILQWLEPEIFTSKNAFGRMYLEVISEGNKWNNYASAQFGGVRKDREDAFWEMLKRYMVRHRKEEVASWLPPKQYVHHNCEMKPAQLKQYKQFAADAEITIQEQNLGAVGILAEYTRLKQFANAECVVEVVGKDIDPETGITKDKLKLRPLENSGKLDQLDEIMAEIGLEKDIPANDRQEQLIVFTQFTDMADLLVTWMRKRYMRVAKITGDVKLEDRDLAQEKFRNKELDVMIMNTKAGGVAINLETCNTVVFMDEMWDPDDQEQAEDRAHRTSKTDQVTIHYLRSVGTVEHHIWNTTKGKAEQNWNVLDARRGGFSAEFRA